MYDECGRQVAATEFPTMGLQRREQRSISLPSGMLKAPCITHERALHCPKRALHCPKRALHFPKRALHTQKGDVLTRVLRAEAPDLQALLAPDSPLGAIAAAHPGPHGSSRCARRYPLTTPFGGVGRRGVGVRDPEPMSPISRELGAAARVGARATAGSHLDARSRSRPCSPSVALGVSLSSSL
jgi:hypothetical protein